MDVFQATVASLWVSEFDHMNKVVLLYPEDEHTPRRSTATAIRSPSYASIGMVVLLSFTPNDGNDVKSG